MEVKILAFLLSNHTALVVAAVLGAFTLGLFVNTTRDIIRRVFKLPINGNGNHGKASSNKVAEEEYKEMVAKNEEKHGKSEKRLTTLETNYKNVAEDIKEIKNTLSKIQESLAELHKQDAVLDERTKKRTVRG